MARPLEERGLCGRWATGRGPHGCSPLVTTGGSASVRVSFPSVGETLPQGMKVTHRGELPGT